LLGDRKHGLSDLFVGDPEDLPTDFVGHFVGLVEVATGGNAGEEGLRILLEDAAGQSVESGQVAVLGELGIGLEPAPALGRAFYLGLELKYEIALFGGDGEVVGGVGGKGEADQVTFRWL